MRQTFALVAFVIPVMLGTAAYAQDTATDSEIITVRGQREDRFTAPVSSVHLSGSDAQNLGTLDEVVTRVPGLSMINDQDPGTNIVALRGVTTDRLQQAAIVYVLDGVPLADTEFFTGPLFDLRNVEVLRGPQGALFGKGAAGGVVAIETGSGANYLAAGLGNGGYRLSEGAFSRQVNQTWSISGAGQWRAADGWITNRTLGRVADAEESRALRLRVNGQLTPRSSVELGLFGMEDDGGAAWASSGDVTGDFGGKLDGAALTDPIGDFEGRSSRSWVQARARLTTETNLGTLSLLLARDDYQKRWVEELDYRPGALTFFGVPAFPNGLQPIAQPTDIIANTAEVRLSGSRGNTDYVAGLFRQDVNRVRTDDFGPLLFGGPASRYDTDSLQSAAFFGLFHRIGPLRLEAQGRYDRDERTQIITAAGTRLERRDGTFERFQPRVGASLAVNENTVLYTSYGEGFRSGGFNPRPSASALWKSRFESEITRSLEGGVRLRSQPGGTPSWWRFDLTAFQSAIDNYQNYTFLEGQSVTLNVDQVSVHGGEIAFGLGGETASGVQWALEGGYALADSEIDRYIAPDPLIAGATRNYSGRQVPNAPAWSGVLTASGTWPSDTHTTRLSAAVNAAGPTYYEIDNALRSPARTWLDLQADYTVHGWTATVWGRNVTDERWAISAFGQGMLSLLAGLGPDGPFDTFTINRGRQFGLTVRRDF
jgi:iron complex outermembrane receptor protein